MPRATFDFLGAIPDGCPRLSQCDAVILYGAGNFGKELAAVLTKRGVPIVCFLDWKATPGAAIQGIPILRPDDASVERAKKTVIVSIFNREVSIPSIIDDLRGRGFASVFSFLDLYDEVWDDMGDRFWLSTRSTYRNAGAAIEEVDALWADEQSRDLYRRIIRFRVSGDHRVLPAVEARQYYPATIPAWRNPLRLVDAGAYDGDSLRGFLGAGHTVQAFAAFEPESDNFARLSEFVRRRPEGLGSEVSLFPCGLWSRTQQVSFAAGHGEASHIGADGGTVIQGVRLDDALPSFAPTVIKLDIEGAEPDAIAGAAHAIRDHLPGLAVCLYHRPDHLWTIPLQIRALSAAHQLYLRCHGHSTFDLVLYGVPHSIVP
jgi:FkbM family methyltransferase